MHRMRCHPAMHFKMPKRHPNDLMAAIRPLGRADEIIEVLPHLVDGRLHRTQNVVGVFGGFSAPEQTVDMVGLLPKPEEPLAEPQARLLQFAALCRRHLTDLTVHVGHIKAIPESGAADDESGPRRRDGPRVDCRAGKK